MAAGWGRVCLLLAALALFSTAAADQCSEYSNADCWWANHTFCDYPKPGFARECGEVDVDAGTVTAEDQRDILRLHNEIRRMVAKGDYEKYGLPAAAKPIGNLTWNPESAAIAQRLANQCQEKPDICRNLKDGTYSSQNRAMTSNVAKSWKKTIYHLWFSNQLKDVKNTLDGLKYKSTAGGAGHLIKVIREKTKSVGCGYMEFKRRPHIQQLYVCNYAPGGNYWGQEVYTAQRPEES